MKFSKYELTLCSRKPWLDSSYLWNGRHVWINSHYKVYDYNTDEWLGNLTEDKFDEGWKEYCKVMDFRRLMTRSIIALTIVLVLGVLLTVTYWK